MFVETGDKTIKHVLLQYRTIQSIYLLGYKIYKHNSFVCWITQPRELIRCWWESTNEQDI